MLSLGDSNLLLLDTHVWIWFMLATADLRSRHRTEINQAAMAGRVRIAAISLWEAAMLASRGRVRLEKPIALWLPQALTAPGILVEPLTPEIAIESCQLPGQTHGDPADRMIIATARVIGARLMTHDRAILDYARWGHLQVIRA